MGTLRKVKGVYPLMDKGFRLLWYICMGEVQLYRGTGTLAQNHSGRRKYGFSPKTATPTGGAGSRG